MAKKEQEMYEGMPVIEASDAKSLEKKLAAMEWPEKYVVKTSKTAKKIKNSAFKDNKEMVTILISDAVTEIEDYAFEGCTGLTSIVIPDSVTYIGYGAFSGCTGLTSIVVSEGNITYDSRDNCNAIIETKKDELIVGCKNTIIPPSVTVIGKSAFFGCAGLTSVTIPDTVTRIGHLAFCRCTGLTNIVIPDSVTELDSAFDDCTGLTSIVISNSVTEIKNHAFAGCTGLKDIVIPNSVEVIGISAFQNCKTITSIVIPDSVTKIGQYAFSGCTGLTSVVIGKSVKEIGYNAFRYLKEGWQMIPGCINLQSIVVNEDNPTYDSRENCNAIIETETNKLIIGSNKTVIPNSVTEIGESAFLDYAGLTNITIPDSVTKIGGSAFWGCKGLTSVTIPNSVTEIGRSAFWGCTGLTSIVIPDSVTVIRNAAFSSCKDLKSVTFEGNLTEIEYDAFYCCSSLEKINVPAKRAAYYKKLLPQELKRLVVESSQEAATAKKTLVKKSPVKETSSAKKTPVKKATVKKHEITLYPENCYRLVLLPVVGEESNQLIDENGFDLGTFYSIDQISAEFSNNYEFFLDFYSSEDGIEYTVNNKTRKELKDNALNIDKSKFDLEEAGREPDDDFILVGNLTKANVEYKEIIEIFNDIMARHNNATEDEHVDIVFDAICRRMRQVAEQLVEEGLAEDVKSVRFALQFGPVQGVEYSFEIETDRFNSKLLRTINCEDWNDCSRSSDTLLEYWPDRLLGCIVYDGKLYEGYCNQADDYNFLIDLVNCKMESLL